MAARRYARRSHGRVAASALSQMSSVRTGQIASGVKRPSRADETQATITPTSSAVIADSAPENEGGGPDQLRGEDAPAPTRAGRRPHHVGRRVSERGGGAAIAVARIVRS
jgi:hypothetical protein